MGANANPNGDSHQFHFGRDYYVKRYRRQLARMLVEGSPCATDTPELDTGVAPESSEGIVPLEPNSTQIPQPALATFIELLPDITLLVRPTDTRIIGANRAAVAAYGYAHAELLSLSILQLRAAETVALTGAELAKADSEGIRFETVHRRKDGTHFEVEVSSRGLFDGQNRAPPSAIRDVSERYRAQAALRTENSARRRALAALADSESRYRMLFNALPEGVMELDTDGRIERCESRSSANVWLHKPRRDDRLRRSCLGRSIRTNGIWGLARLGL